MKSRIVAIDKMRYRILNIQLHPAPALIKFYYTNCDTLSIKDLFTPGGRMFDKI